MLYTCSWWCFNELTPSYTLNLRASKDQGKKITQNHVSGWSVLFAKGVKLFWGTTIISRQTSPHISDKCLLASCGKLHIQPSSSYHNECGELLHICFFFSSSMALGNASLANICCVELFQFLFSPLKINPAC